MPHFNFSIILNHFVPLGNRKYVGQSVPVQHASIGPASILGANASDAYKTSVWHARIKKKSVDNIPLTFGMDAVPTASSQMGPVHILAFRIRTIDNTQTEPCVQLHRFLIVTNNKNYVYYKVIFWHIYSTKCTIKGKTPITSRARLSTNSPYVKASQHSKTDMDKSIEKNMYSAHIRSLCQFK